MRGGVVTVQAPLALECVIDGQAIEADEFIEIRGVDSEVLAIAPDLSEYAITRALRAARKARRQLDELSYEDLCAVFRKAAEYYDGAFDYAITAARGHTLAKSIGARMGIQHMLRTFDEVVEHAFNGRLHQSKCGALDVTHYHDPVGVVAILPASTAREIAPWSVLSALAVGNPVVLKLDSKEPFSAVELEQSLRRAGLPAGAFNTLAWDTKRKPELGARLVRGADKSVLFGWDQTIKQIAYADIAGQLAPDLLEQLPIPRNIVAFGTGRSKALVFGARNLAKAARSLAYAATYAPTECLKVQFVVVERQAKAAFVEAYREAASRLQTGKLTDGRTVVGHASAQNRGFVQHVMADAIQLGARELLGNDVLCQPTLFDEVHVESALFREETPAPSLGLLACDTLEEGIELINSSVRFAETQRSLAVAVYTDDDSVYRRCLMQLDACRVTRNRPPIRVDHKAPHQGLLLPLELTEIKGAR